MPQGPYMRGQVTHGRADALKPGETTPPAPGGRGDGEGELVVVTVLGADRPGIVAGIAGVLASRGVNIVDISQTVVRGIFSMIMIVDLSTGDAGLEELRRELVEKGRELGVEVTVNHISVFRAMQRI